MTEPGTFCWLWQMARKWLLDHTGIKEQEFKIHRVMAYKHRFLVTQLSGKVFQMIHWPKPYFRLRKLLRWGKRASSKSTDVCLTFARWEKAGTLTGNAGLWTAPGDAYAHPQRPKEKLTMLQLCKDVLAWGRATASAALPQLTARGGPRAHRSAEGRNCPSALKQKQEGRAAVSNEWLFPPHSAE